MSVEPNESMIELAKAETICVAGRRMCALKTICEIYDWKYDTVYKKFKRGEFVRAYRDPVGRGLRFDLEEVDQWAKQCPIEPEGHSIILDHAVSHNVVTGRHV